MWRDQITIWRFKNPPCSKNKNRTSQPQARPHSPPTLAQLHGRRRQLQVFQRTQSSPSDCPERQQYSREPSNSPFPHLTGQHQREDTSTSPAPSPNASQADSDQSVHKRARHEDQNPSSPESTGDGEEEEEETSGNNRDNYGFTGKWFVTPTCNYGCLYNMWTPMLEILEIGKLDNHQITEANYSKRVWRKITLYRALIKAIPELHKRAKALGVSLLDLASLLDKKRSDARNEDVQHIKDNSQLLQPKLKAFHPPLTMNDKIT
ncbi:hypothetical protein M422DRAFT_264844 [Sphaerobolus stellatus SS14]|uniref:Unplaced genomic scaffold SPHSTscaffold_140, whole genome shotgun sequence n=1 Tax=Sphaerobolus stellatus (strain SS14) TaxID=990650 RepID=A0A0C9V782_SPHS4|nr:hypothetical protein M422DRAFT_264844 [Sphaerobolus stellatus SS14]